MLSLCMNTYQQPVRERWEARGLMFGPLFVELFLDREVCEAEAVTGALARCECCPCG